MVKTWRLVSLYLVILVLLSYVIFVTSLSMNVSLYHKQQATTVGVKVSNLTTPTLAIKISSAILLQPDVYNYRGELHLAFEQNSEQVKLMPFIPLLMQSLIHIIFPVVALLIISFTTLVFNSLYQFKKMNKKLLPICDKAGRIVKKYDSTFEDDANFTAFIRLDYALNTLTKLEVEYKANVEQSAFCDKLTKLVDRHKFLEHINKQIDMTANTQQKSGLLFIDLDGFKQVNDSFGHSFGDEVLIQVAERLKSIVRRQKLNFNQDETEVEYNLARLGGDEFTIFIKELDNAEKAVSVAGHVLQELERDFVLGNKTIKISASIGIAVYPDSASTPSMLVQMADVAMYRAKTDGTGVYRIYSPEMGTKMRRYHYLLDQMREAMDSGHFFVAFQPIIHVDGCNISYFEALVRWEHPIDGTINPAEFIPIAEDSNLILELGDWILAEACRQMAAWYNAGMKNVRISVNVSGIQLKHRSLNEWVMEAISRAGLPASSLMLEITESCFIEASDEIICELEKLRAEGVMIAIDDFGTGFSSLSLLATLPVDILKIDQLFISEAMANKKYNKILRSIVEMAEKLDLKVVAEGIERVDQLELLKSLGVVYIQGYLISRPQRPSYVGKKVFDHSANHLAQTGTGVWAPQPSRFLGSS